MAEIKQIAISDIGVIDRLRPVDEEHAKAIAVSVAQIGVINPITVRFTPAAKTGKFTLVAGGHRMRAAEICDLQTVPAIVVQATGDEAEAIEIAENFFRNDLSVIDRAAFGERFRELWEKNVGPIARGRKRDIGANLSPIFEGRFKDAIANRLGVSASAAKRLHRIAAGLHPALREKLRGTPEADNESFLLSLVRAGIPTQQGMIAAMNEGADARKAFSFRKPPKPEADRQEKALKQFKAAWKAMDAATRAAALKSVGVDKAA